MGGGHRERAHLDAVLQGVVPQQLAVDAEQAEVSLVEVDDTVALGGGLDEARPVAAFEALQGPQQVPVHGVDQTGALWNSTRRNDYYHNNNNNFKNRVYKVLSQTKQKTGYSADNITTGKENRNAKQKQDKILVRLR